MSPTCFYKLFNQLGRPITLRYPQPGDLEMAWGNHHPLSAPDVSPDRVSVVLGLWGSLDVIDAVDSAVADEWSGKSVLFSFHA